MIALNDFYGCDQTPFTKSIATQHLFPSQSHQEVQARLRFALQERLPALITGDVGTGKSTGDCVDPVSVPSVNPWIATSTESSTSPTPLSQRPPSTARSCWACRSNPLLASGASSLSSTPPSPIWPAEAAMYSSSLTRPTLGRGSPGGRRLSSSHAWEAAGGEAAGRPTR